MGGDGRSGATEAPVTIYDLVDDDTALPNAEGIESAVWMRLSIGALLSLRVARTGSQRVGSLVRPDIDAEPRSVWKRLEYQVMKWGLKHLDPRVIPPALLPIMRGRTTLREHAELRSEYADNFPGMHLDSDRPGTDVIIARDDLLSHLP